MNENNKDHNRRMSHLNRIIEYNKDSKEKEN